MKNIHQLPPAYSHWGCAVTKSQALDQNRTFSPQANITPSTEQNQSRLFFKKPKNDFEKGREPLMGE